MKPLSKSDLRVIDRDGVNATMARRVLDVVDKGLVNGIGSPIPGQMCVEAAVAFAYGEDHNDKPDCVDETLSDLKISLNDDGEWDSNEDRARGLRRLAIAQLGSKHRFDIDTFWDLMNHVPPPVKEAKKALLAVKKKIDVAIRSLNEETTHEDVRDLLGGIGGSASSEADNFEDPVYLNEIGDWLWQAQDHHELAEKMVQCLIEMKIPGTKYLYLTEKKKKSAKRPVKKTKKVVKTKSKAKKKKTAK